VNRKVTKVQMGGNKIAETVRIESDPTFGPEEGHRGFMALWYFIQSLQTNPTLIRNSVDCPSTLKLSFQGSSWVMETVAIVDAPADRA
jgi:hypothetical protein